MTEEEAKTKWCPMFSMAYETAGYNMGDGPETLTRRPVRANCIGSACMMFRWDEVRNPNWHPHMATTEEPFIRSETEGYCGLAGKP